MSDDELRQIRLVVERAVQEAVRPIAEEVRALRAQLGNPNRLLPCREVAERYGVSTRTVKRRVEQGEMWAIDRGRRGLYFTQEEAERAGSEGILP